MAHFSNLKTQEHKVKAEDRQKFLSESQYDFTEIYKYERCFGEGFMSAGGIDTAKEFINLGNFDKNAGISALDVGCGIGGSDFYLAEEYGANVIGLDLSTTCIELANQRLKKKPGLEKLVTFELADAFEKDYPPATFDLIYSRDALLHVPYSMKPALWKKFYEWLKPGGQLIISDYGCGEGELSTEMKTYMAKRQYALLSPTAYGELTRGAGFETVTSMDRSWQYCQLSTKEINRIQSSEAAAAFDSEFSSAQREAMIKVFNDKVNMCVRSDRTFIVLHAVKQRPYHEYRAQVLKVCKQMYEQHLVWGTDGNVSMKIPGTDLMAIKGSGIPYPDLQIDDIVVCKLNGERIPGEKKPSSEINLHIGIYAARPDANGCVHTHSMYASTIACCRLTVPCYHYSVGEIAMDTDNILTAPYFTYGTPELAQAVVDAIGPSRMGCLMANHGQVTLGASLDDAFYFALRMENICEMYYRVLGIPSGAVNLTAKDMANCRIRDKTYGQVEDGTGTGHGCCR